MSFFLDLTDFLVFYKIMILSKKHNMLYYKFVMFTLYSVFKMNLANE